MDRIQAMLVFVTVVEKRSLSTAAASLGMSLPSVSRILSTLERELGVRLIVRNARGLAETDGGACTIAAVSAFWPICAKQTRPCRVTHRYPPVSFV